MRLQGKTAIVTGGRRGIGYAIAELFAKEGATVYATARSAEKFDNPNIIGVALDVTDRDGIAKFVGGLDKPVDILVNNAGIIADGLIQKLSEADWDKVINTNLKGVFNITQVVAPMMMANGAGSIINMSSVVAIYGNVGQTNYIAAKAGVIGMTKCWSKEFARKGAKIRVNAVAPGFIKTDMTHELPEKVIDMMVSKTPLGRMGEAEDIANAVLFLASDESTFVTGQVLSVDGGLVI